LRRALSEAEAGPLSERLLTAAELGELLGLSPSTVLDRFQAGDLPGFRLFGKKGGPVRFRLSEIEAALACWRVGDPLRCGQVQKCPGDASTPRGRHEEVSPHAP